MTALDDATWIGSLIVGAYLTLYLAPIVLSSISLYIIGELTWKWLHAHYYLQTVFGTLTVFLLLLCFLKRGGK